MANYGHVILFALLGGVVSLIGGAILLRKASTAEKLAKYATPFAAGALLAAVFLDLLPEGVEQTAASTVLIAALIGVLLFFFAERFLHWFHHHHQHEGHGDPSKSLIIAGDTAHNALDGIAIGAAFLVSIPTGIVTTVAVAAHEIPQEIGDFGLLLKKGMSRKKVLIVNVLSALATVVLAVVTFALGSAEQLPVGILLGASAGFLLYIAMSDVIPDLHEHSPARRKFDPPALLLLAGAILVGLVIQLSHSVINEGHDHNEEPNHSQHVDGHDEEHEAGHQAHGEHVIDGHDELPSLEILVRKDNKSGYNLELHVEHFEFAPDETGHEHVDGQGHAHLYVNGEKVTRLYGEHYYLGELEEGSVVRVTLNGNDHGELMHDGMAIAAELIISGADEQSAHDPFSADMH